MSIDVFFGLVYVGFACLLSLYLLKLSLKHFSKIELCLWFGFHALAGMVYYGINQGAFQGGDINIFLKNAESLLELTEGDIHARLKLIFGSCNGPVEANIRPAVEAMNHWFHPSPYAVVRLHALAMLVSSNNSFIHILLLALPGFLGSVFLATAFSTWGIKSIVVKWSILLTPSVLFWSSGMHKESLMAWSIGLFVLGVTFTLHSRKYVLGGLVMGLSLLPLIIVRDYIFLSMVPALLVWLVPAVRRAWPAYVFSYTAALVCGFFLKIPRYGQTAFQLLVDKRDQFLNLKVGATSYAMKPIENAKDLPLALLEGAVNGFFRPFPQSLSGELILLASAENIMVFGLVIYALYQMLKRVRSRALPLVLLSWGLCLLLIIGMVVPNAGALVRYRSMALMLIVPSAISIIIEGKRLVSGFR